MKRTRGWIVDVLVGFFVPGLVLQWTLDDPAKRPTEYGIVLLAAVICGVAAMRLWRSYRETD